jgi:rhamnulose-1-phosphate aldolase
MNALLNALPQLEEIRQVAHWLAVLNWSEAAGGNFSIRLAAVPEELAALMPAPERSLPVQVPSLAGQYLLVSGTGTRARDIAVHPEHGMGLYRILPGGKAYVWLCGNQNPTSEMPSHCAIHHTLEEVRPEHTAILHTHPPRLIAATHLEEFFDARKMSEVLLRMQSEARLLLPEGLAHLRYYLPGSLELGLASAEAVKRCFIVLWHLHGALATGPSLSSALDYLQYVDKAAEVYWILRSAGEKIGGMKDEDIEHALRTFGRWERYENSLKSPGSQAAG